jgi:hypothetical protein
MAIDIKKRVARLEARLIRLDVLIERAPNKTAKTELEKEKEAREAELKFMKYKAG